MSIYKQYKHGGSIKSLIKEYGLQTVFNCLKRAGLPVQMHNKRLKILNEITNRYILLR